MTPRNGMKICSVKLPAALDARLAGLAKRSGRSKSALVRDALEMLLEGPPRTNASALALVQDLVGRLAGPGDLSYRRERLRGFGR